MMLTFACEILILMRPSALSGSLLGLCYAIIGLNIMHDASHGAVSAKPWVNTLLTLTQDYIGGSSLLWLQEHIVIHHVDTNSLAHDKDMLDTPLLRFSPLRSKWWWNQFQVRGGGMSKRRGRVSSSMTIICDSCGFSAAMHSIWQSQIIPSRNRRP
jgi:fatty acid desaturase